MHQAIIMQPLQGSNELAHHVEAAANSRKDAHLLVLGGVDELAEVGSTVLHFDLADLVGVRESQDFRNLLYQVKWRLNDFDMLGWLRQVFQNF